MLLVSASCSTAGSRPCPINSNVLDILRSVRAHHDIVDITEARRLFGDMPSGDGCSPLQTSQIREHSSQLGCLCCFIADLEPAAGPSCQYNVASISINTTAPSHDAASDLGAMFLGAWRPRVKAATDVHDATGNDGEHESLLWQVADETYEAEVAIKRVSQQVWIVYLRLMHYSTTAATDREKRDPLRSRYF